MHVAMDRMASVAYQMLSNYAVSGCTTIAYRLPANRMTPRTCTTDIDDMTTGSAYCRIGITSITLRVLGISYLWYECDGGHTTAFIMDNGPIRRCYAACMDSWS